MNELIYALGVLGIGTLAIARKISKTQSQRSSIEDHLIAAGLSTEETAKTLGLEVVSATEFEVTFNQVGQTTDNIKKQLTCALPLFGAVTYELSQLSPTRYHVLFSQNEREYPTEIAYCDHKTQEKPDVRRVLVAFGVKSEPIYADMTIHALTSAISGAGKSGLLNIIMARLAYSNEILVFGIDLKRGIELSPWKERLTLFAKDIQGALSLLTTVEKIMNERFDEMEKQGLRKTEPSGENPWILVVVDEIARLHSNDKAEQKEIERLLTSLSAMGRAAGITLWASTQRPGVEAIAGGDNVRSNLIVRNVLKLANREQLRLSIGSGVEIEDQDNPINFPLDVKGLCLFSHPEQKVGRIIYVNDDDVKKIVSETKHLNMAIETSDWRVNIGAGVPPAPM